MLLRLAMIRTLLLFILSFHAFAGNPAALAKITEVKRIAFGSCSDQKDPQPLWEPLRKEAPDLFIHGGDNIYADTTNVEELKKTWEWLKGRSDYSAFRKDTAVIGIWDDHDFGFNDADGTVAFKKESQELFLNFLEEPEDSERRRREGIYTSHAFGSGPKKIKFILLDNRYFRNLDKKAPLLGRKQWEWLEGELKDSDAGMHFIVSGLSVLSPRIPRSDGWSDYPEEKKRLLKLLDRMKPKAPVFLTGDKHFASIFMRDGHLEFLSSGLTHNRPKWMRPLLSAFYPFAVHKLNYGLIDISWVGDEPVLRMAIKLEGGKTGREESYHWQKSEWKRKTL